MTLPTLAKFLLVAILLSLFPGCCRLNQLACAVAQNRAETVVPPSALPMFSDDLPRESLIAALDNSLSYWRKSPGHRTVQLCGRNYAAPEIMATLTLFKEIALHSPAEELDSRIKEHFDICPANNNQEFLVTGYYQPVFQGSLVSSPPYLYPLYRVPDDLIHGNDEISGKKRPGRLGSDGRLLPYWSRAEIEDGRLLEGQELVYLADPVQAFILHVQGSGLIRLPDGSLRAILFADSNGREYRSIGRLLAEEKRIPLAQVTMPRIAAYLHEHVDERQRILHYNPRYIFFRWEAENGDHGVFGSMGAELTAGRSVALDNTVYPLGLPAFLDSWQPTFPEKQVAVAPQPLRRFVVNQDSGAAITGAGRLDLFWGRGQEAEAAAGVMKQPGRLYFFSKKTEGTP